MSKQIDEVVRHYTGAVLAVMQTTKNRNKNESSNPVR